MESCHVCSSSLEPEKTIHCNGSCGKAFHSTCVGLTKSQFSSMTAKIGLLWFCTSCRLNFDPAVYERDKIIMKALRQLLIRTDSMDIRLGNYGDSLRKINKTLYENQSNSKSMDHTSFLQRIDELTLDDTIDDPVNPSRSCEETSFFEVLDEVNSSIACMPDKFIVGSNKRVQILTSRPESSENTTNSTRIDVSTPAVPTQPTKSSIVGNKPSTSRENPVLSGPKNTALKVANGSQSANDVETFYVTPFEPDQSEDEVKKYVMDISNLHSPVVKVTKLVPRGRRIEDLSFVSFKVAVCKSASSVVGDSFYWPEGVSVRLFEPNQKNQFAARLPIPE